MKFDLENASLVLNTYESTMTDNNTINTWTNVNLKSVLGDMFDKYETFNLCLSVVNTDVTGTEMGNGIDGVSTRICIMYISGLPFVNQTYSFKKNTLTNEAVLGTLILPLDTTTTSEQYYFGSSSVATFRSPSEMTNITIKLTKINNATPTPTYDFPEMVFIFDIYGVESKKTFIDNRIKNI